MKKLLATTLALILLGTSAFGAEIKMECELPSAVWYFKYAERTLMKDKAYTRVNGRWIDICDGLQTYHQTIVDGLGDSGKKVLTECDIQDKSAIVGYEFPNGKTSDGESFEKAFRWIIDFETKQWSFYFTDSRYDWSDNTRKGLCK